MPFAAVLERVDLVTSEIDELLLLLLSLHPILSATIAPKTKEGNIFFIHKLLSSLSRKREKESVYKEGGGSKNSIVLNTIQLIELRAPN